jgi:hypothetical protein
VAISEAAPVTATPKPDKPLVILSRVIFWRLLMSTTALDSNNLTIRRSKIASSLVVSAFEGVVATGLVVLTGLLVSVPESYV